MGLLKWSEVLDDLIHCATTHFASEASLLSDHGCVAAAIREAAHAAFLGRVRDIRLRLDGGSDMLTVGMLRFLTDALSNHIVQSRNEWAATMT